MYYTVKEIAAMLHINQETVRRWIRNGNLKAERALGRQGNKVNEDILKKFLEDNKSLATDESNAIFKISIPEKKIIDELIQNTISAISSSKIINILTKNKEKKELLKELENQKLELIKSTIQLKLEISKYQNELNNLEEQIDIIDEILNK